MIFEFRALDAASAQQIVAWRYAEPYTRYNLAPSDVPTLLAPTSNYFAAHDDNGDVFGFCCFGAEAQVPGGDYSDADTIDIGIGLRPNLTGHGEGRLFLEAALAFGQHKYPAAMFRATIAAFNTRALRVAESAGFRERSRFVSPGSDLQWAQLTTDPNAELRTGSAASSQIRK